MSKLCFLQIFDHSVLHSDSMAATLVFICHKKVIYNTMLKTKYHYKGMIKNFNNN